MGNAQANKGEVPKIITTTQTNQREKGEELARTTRGPIDTGIQQFMSLLAGGRGAKVPLISRAVAGQQAATRNTQKAISQAGGRGGIDPEFINRLTNTAGIEGNAAANQIGPRVASKSILSNILNAITGGKQVQNIINAGNAAAAAGFRLNRPSGAPSVGAAAANAAVFAAQGGFNDIGKLFSNFNNSATTGTSFTVTPNTAAGTSGGTAAGSAGFGTGSGSSVPALTSG